MPTTAARPEESAAIRLVMEKRSETRRLDRVFRMLIAALAVLYFFIRRNLGFLPDLLFHKHRNCYARLRTLRAIHPTFARSYRRSFPFNSLMVFIIIHRCRIVALAAFESHETARPTNFPGLIRRLALDRTCSFNRLHNSAHCPASLIHGSRPLIISYVPNHRGDPKQYVPVF